MSSDNYRDGCSKRAGVIPFLVITAVQVAAFLFGLFDRRAGKKGF